MTDNWDDSADTWDTNDDVIYYSEKAYESLVKIINIDGQRILDFGCGTGLLSERMSPLASSVVAIDTSSKMVNVLKYKKLSNVTPLSTSLTQELISKNSVFAKKFNIVVASSVLSFVPDYESTLRLLKSALVTDGLLVQWDWLAQDSDPEFGLSENTIKNTLTDVGFSDIVLKKPFSISFEKGDSQVVMGIAKNAKQVTAVGQ